MPRFYPCRAISKRCRKSIRKFLMDGSECLRARIQGCRLRIFSDRMQGQDEHEQGEAERQRFHTATIQSRDRPIGNAIVKEQFLFFATLRLCARS